MRHAKAWSPDYVHFFASREAAAPWVARHPGTFVHAIEEAVEIAPAALAHPITGGVFSDPGDTCEMIAVDGRREVAHGRRHREHARLARPFRRRRAPTG